jgi:hypothetical protein
VFETWTNVRSAVATQAFFTCMHMTAINILMMMFEGVSGFR